ncbi:MAG: bis(5'-nucleosyl)-tetraphosphatase (symmetrical) YqeK [Clostridia bacterium]|nr:bis(5'-nucleosyl)-tetraphosphatase (symmetrical) YqeK [Clostridia bacterium]
MKLSKKYDEYIALIKNRLDDYRFEHSMAVADKAYELAEKFGADTEKAYVAGLLHDVQKNLSDDEQLQFLSSSAIMLTDVEKASPRVWHAISGAAYIQSELNINDSEIVNAVRYHTTGRAGMSLLEKVIYIADFTSRDRCYPDVDVLRSIVEKSLDEGLIYSLRHTIVSLGGKTLPIHPDTLSAYNELLSVRK